MKKYSMIALVVLFTACGSGGSREPTEITTYGQLINQSIVTGLKTGGAGASQSVGVLSVAELEATLNGSCASPNYTDCPDFGNANGVDEMTGEIVMKIWGLDYNDECTADAIAAGTCFEDGNNMTYIMPTMLASPAQCFSTSTTAGHYVNFGVDPCFFDAVTGMISNYTECKAYTGTDVNITTAIPWYETWGIFPTISFSSFYAYGGGGGILWTIVEGANANSQVFLSIDSNWLYYGMKDRVSKKFKFFGTGSPAYFASRGEGSGVSIVGYATDLNDNGDVLTTAFETIQVRVQGANHYIVRLKANATHVWAQEWLSTAGGFPETPDQVAALKDDPSTFRCVEIGAKVVESKYVPKEDCMAAFNKTEAELNSDDWYEFKIIDGQTASSMSFSPLVSYTADVCMPSEAEQNAGN